MLPVTYCTNIHPGESWAEITRNLEVYAKAVKAALSPAAPFPVGLRLSGRASREVGPDEAARFADWLAEAGMTVAAVNGFPYGTFHGTLVKEAVYLPDWRDRERGDYSLRLAGLLAGWLPAGGAGSISTVPLGFRRGFPSSEVPLALGHLRETLEGLDALAQATGRLVRLSVEPEPGCLVETTAEAVGLFDRLALPPHLAPYLAVCYDCCHQALQFEDPAASIGRLTRNGIAIGHVQVSSALHLAGGDLTALARFNEPVYLHQAVCRLPDGSLLRFDDLPAALAAAVPPDACWRVHFHLPVFLDVLPDCETTQAFLRRALPLFPAGTPLEVETYTFDVLPPALRTARVTDSIVREIGWVEAHRRPGR